MLWNIGVSRTSVAFIAFYYHEAADDADDGSSLEYASWLQSAVQGQSHHYDGIQLLLSSFPHQCFRFNHNNTCRIISDARDSQIGPSLARKTNAVSMASTVTTGQTQTHMAAWGCWGHFPCAAGVPLVCYWCGRAGLPAAVTALCHCAAQCVVCFVYSVSHHRVGIYFLPQSHNDCFNCWHFLACSSMALTPSVSRPCCN